MAEYIVRETGYPGTLKKEIVGELIRCKDCRHWLESRVKTYGQCDCDALMRDAEFFCKSGERKDDENLR